MIEKAFARCGIFGAESLLKVIEDITSNTTTGAKMTGRSVNPMSTPAMKDWLAKIFRTDLTGAGITNCDYHIKIIAVEGAAKRLKALPKLSTRASPSSASKT